jgi:hypothetical protein
MTINSMLRLQIRIPSLPLPKLTHPCVLTCKTSIPSSAPLRLSMVTDARSRYHSFISTQKTLPNPKRYSSFTL